MSEYGILKPSSEVREAFKPILAVLPEVRKAIGDKADVAVVRPGYDDSNVDVPVPAVIVAVTPGTRPIEASDLNKQFNVPFRIIDATVEEQLDAQNRLKVPIRFGVEQPVMGSFEAMLADQELEAFRAPRTGAYEPLNPAKLPLITENLRGTICFSPEGGWEELEKFLAATRERLSVAMYQFTAPHIFEAIKDAVSPPGVMFKLVLHPIPEPPAQSGAKAEDLREVEDVLKPLEKKLKKRFEHSWATLNSKKNPDGLWASAYHIKVAVRDREAVWLSSGNWQSSNQPNVHPFSDPGTPLPRGFHQKYNRDYHAILESKSLADVYETYIDRDYELTSAAEVETFGMPDLIVPELEAELEALEFAQPAINFAPLELDGSRKIAVQPLLTPDNYAEHALNLIRSAKNSVWFQNQYINYRGNGEDFNDFNQLVAALKEKLDDGLDVRIICRDMMKQESVDVLVGLGFARNLMRFQKACHNKTIIVDRKVAMFGSHNWSNEGVKTNRDASLIFFDPEIAQKLGEVFEHDWDRLATSKPMQSRPRVARDGEVVPAGHRRVPFAAVFED